MGFQNIISTKERKKSQACGSHIVKTLNVIKLLFNSLMRKLVRCNYFKGKSTRCINLEMRNVKIGIKHQSWLSPQDQRATLPPEVTYTHTYKEDCILLSVITTWSYKIAFIGSKSAWKDETKSELVNTVPLDYSHTHSCTCCHLCLVLC